MNTGTDRALTDIEREVLLHILSAVFPGASELRRQVADAKVRGNWEPTDSPSVDIYVSESTQRAPIPDGPVPVAAHVTDEGGSYVGELLIWVTDGRISALEYSWVTDEPPNKLPDARHVQLSTQAKS